MKQKLLFTLCASILTLGVTSCGEASSSSNLPSESSQTSSSETSSSIEESSSNESSSSSKEDESSSKQDDASLAKVKTALEKAATLEASKVTSASISLRENEYHQVEVDGVSSLKNTRYNISNNSLTFYSNKALTVEEEKITSATTGEEEIVKTKTNYGIANSLLVKEVSDYSNKDETYSVNSLKSSSQAIVESNPKNGEVSLEQANSIFATGLFNVVVGAINKQSQTNVVSFILDNYLSKFENPEVSEGGNTFTLTATVNSEDDVENVIINEYELTLTFSEEGALLSANGNFSSFESVLGLKGDKTFEYVLSVAQEVGTRGESSVDLSKYFFQSEEELSIGFSTTKLGELEQIKTLNQPYFIRVTKAIASRNENIDKVKLYKIEKDGVDDCSDCYVLDESDDTTTLTIKKGGKYTLHFKTALLNDIQEEVNIVVNDITSIAFPEMQTVFSVYTKDNSYLPGAILKGETPFAINVNPTNATDDISFSISGDDTALITKEDTSFNYKLSTTKASDLTIKATSAVLGEENSITKKVKVYDTTDEGIASFIGNTTWSMAGNTTSSIKAISFAYASGSSGTFSMTSKASVEATSTGTYTVINGSVVIETTEISNEKGTKLTALTVTPGRGDIVAKVGRDVVLQN